MKPLIVRPDLTCVGYPYCALAFYILKDSDHYKSDKFQKPDLGNFYDLLKIAIREQQSTQSSSDDVGLDYVNEDQSPHPYNEVGSNEDLSDADAASEGLSNDDEGSSDGEGFSDDDEGASDDNLDSEDEGRHEHDQRIFPRRGEESSNAASTHGEPYVTSDDVTAESSVRYTLANEETGQSQPVNLIDDYRYRGDSLKDLSLYRFLGLYQRCLMGRNERRYYSNIQTDQTAEPLVPASSGPSLGGRPFVRRVRFSEGHPLRNSHLLQQRTNPWIPTLPQYCLRSYDEDAVKHDRHLQHMALLFIPFVEISDLLPPD